MLTRYFEAAMKRAEYEDLGDEGWYGHIPGFQGLWAEGPSQAECSENLRAALEVWVMVGLYFHDPLPVVDGLDLSVRTAA
jgi:predicted RNase H-like HicB family nuclease